MTPSPAVRSLSVSAHVGDHRLPRPAQASFAGDEHFGSRLTIDADALGENWRQLVARAGRAECAAVVKADAYGLGLATVVGQLGVLGCRTYFVAHVSEGVALRALEPEATIYLLNGLLPGAAPACREARLRPVLGSLPEIEDWTARGGGQPCALQIDTGMNRLGLPAPLHATAARMTARLDLALVLSHLVWSGTPERAGEIAQQIALFEAARRIWRGVPASMANSTGLFFDQAAHYDLVRPGYAIYGGNPTPAEVNPMRTVVTFDATVVQMREVPAGTPVGYDSRWIAPGPRRLATIGAGYADGVPTTALGTDTAINGFASVGGVPCPLVGRVSMDLVVIDVTDAPVVARGDRVELIGPTIRLDDVARRAGTIGYAILTGLGRRSQRRLLGGVALDPRAERAGV